MSEPQAPSAQSSTVKILAFWLILGAVLWWFFDREQDRRDALRVGTVGAGGELVLKRERDGHFYVRGAVNGVAVDFVVDTGASSVAISEQVERDAGLTGGTPVTTLTANGPRPARLYREVAVSAGAARVAGVEVSAGLNMGDPSAGLLGQSFLRNFNVTIEGDTMRMRPRALQ